MPFGILTKALLLAVLSLICVIDRVDALEPGIATGPLTAEEFASEPYFTDIGQYDYARFLMGERDYRVAAREFSRLIEYFPTSPLIPDAQFSLSEAYLYSGRYNDALTEFRLFLDNFKDSPFALVAEVKIREAEDKLRVSEAERSPIPAYRMVRPGMRAVQVMFFEGRTEREIDAELRHLKNSGVDTVIVRAFHNPGDRYYPYAGRGSGSGVYFRTAQAPVVDDILPDLTRLAHANGLRIFAWMTTRYADYGVEDNRALACKGYDLKSRKLYRCKGLDLFNEAAVKRLESLYSDLAENDIDGVLFQDDLVLRHNEGFGESADSYYSALGAFDPESLYLRGGSGDGKVHYTRLFWRWSSMKNRRLLDVADRLRAVVRSKRPGARFAINLMYESVTNPSYALAWLSQDLNAAMKRDFDYYSIMAYHRQMGEELDRDPEEIRSMIRRMVADASEAVGDSGKVLVKLQTVDWRTGGSLADNEVVDLLREIKGLGGVSLAVVPYRGDFPFRELGMRDDLALLN